MTSARSLLAISDLDEAAIRRHLVTARAFAPWVDQGKTIPLLPGRVIVNLFFESSTRTRSSFELAARKLAAGPLGFAPAASSVQKGETLADTARTIMAMGPHCFVIRHPSSGAARILAREVDVPVINGGDGTHEHPTQALLDLYTMEEKLGDMRGKRVVILGDIAHSRVARSNIQALTKVGAQVTICAPPTLLPAKPDAFPVEVAYRPEGVIEQADVVMALRIQIERQNHKMQIPSLPEYRKFWGLTAERARAMKPGAIIMHPGPMNRGVEIDAEVADGPRSVILNQVRNGVLLRMAVLARACEPEVLEKWLSENPVGAKPA